jgi:hypothetical protein
MTNEDVDGRDKPGHDEELLSVLKNGLEGWTFLGGWQRLAKPHGRLQPVSRL